MPAGGVARAAEGAVRVESEQLVAGNMRVWQIVGAAKICCKR